VYLLFSFLHIVLNCDATGYVTLQIIKVDVTPVTRAFVDQSDLRLLTKELYDIPGHPFHRLMAFSGRNPLHLKSENYYFVTNL